MAFTYDAGLRIRPPEPMPDCLEGESAQDYFSRVLVQSAIESATTAENASGDSAPTPFNIGQVQSDLAQLQEDVAELEDSVADLTIKVNNLTDGDASGIETYVTGNTLVEVSLPSNGNWRVLGVVANESALANIFVNSLSVASFVINFDAAVAEGSVTWHARKMS
jgi:hypothetical protein